MSEVMNFYQQQITTQSSLHPKLRALKQHGAEDFARLGFPTRQDEEWKYTSTASFQKQQFEVAPLHTDLRLIWQDGIAHDLEECRNQLPAGMIIQPLLQALEEHPDKLHAHLGKIVQHEHGFLAQNSAMLSNGWFIYLPANVTLNQPLWLRHQQTHPQQATYLRHLVVAEAGSRLTLVEEYQAGTQAGYFTNAVTEVHLAADAQLTHYKLQHESLAAYHFSHLCAQLSERSTLDSHLLNIGGQWVRSDIRCEFRAPDAQCLLNGLYLPGDGQHISQHTTICHALPHCHSKQDYKGILRGQCQAVFNGKVIVAPHAQKSEAHQQNKNLLLSPQAEIDTQPQLEIYANDVICSHGATVGQLDAEALFYLATRGIGYEQACQYLIQAFIADNVACIHEPSVQDWLTAVLNGVSLL